jgi:low temperature requirement protein LtrA
MRPTVPSAVHHHSRPMGGRDPDEAHRVATPLELLFDLTFATSFGLAAEQLAAALANGRYVAALLGFGFASFAICWAWAEFSWFSSAYDTDDWIFRALTMVQMIGVLVLAIGLPRLFASIVGGERFDNSIMVLGYVIMRVALVLQWLRAARGDVARRRACWIHALAIAIAQVGWVMLIILHFSTLFAVTLGGFLLLVELCGPALAHHHGGGTPWHTQHIVERHSLFVLIALGEGVVGTAAALSAVVDQHGWTLDAALVGVAGTGLTFGMWWLYDLLPSARTLGEHRHRAAAWGFGQMMIVTSTVATGAGLGVAARSIEGQARITALAAVLSVAVPVAVYLGFVHAMYWFLVRRIHPFHAWLLLVSGGVVALTVVAALGGLDMARCLVVLTLAPAVTVVGYEMVGYRHHAETLAGRGG